MPEPNVNLVNVFRTFFSGNIMRGGNNRTQKNEQPKNRFELEYEAKVAKEKADKALLAKRERVNSRWNDVKSIFGFGEKLTNDEAKKLVQLDSQKRFTEMEEAHRFRDDEGDSIWNKSRENE